MNSITFGQKFLLVGIIIDTLATIFKIVSGDYIRAAVLFVLVLFLLTCYMILEFDRIDSDIFKTYYEDIQSKKGE